MESRHSRSNSKQYKLNNHKPQKRSKSSGDELTRKSAKPSKQKHNKQPQISCPRSLKQLLADNDKENSVLKSNNNQNNASRDNVNETSSNGDSQTPESVQAQLAVPSTTDLMSLYIKKEQTVGSLEIPEVFNAKKEVRRIVHC